jgi:hypothetical protein
MSATPTDVVIFFVGLALWSSQVPNNQSVHVILPKVHYSKNATQRMPAHTMNSDSQRRIRSVDDSPHVEDHVAAIITYADSFGAVSGWQAPVPIGNQTTFSYVPLDVPLNGDHVKFVTVDSNPSTHDNPPLLLNAVLPKLQGVTALNPAGATIFDLPEGTMKSCLSLTRTQNPRLDTKLTLTTDGNLTVSAGTNQIEIKPYEGMIVLVVADIPTRFLEGDYTPPPELEQVPHVNAFYAMTNASCGNCAQTLKDWLLQHMEEVEPCNSDITLVGGRQKPPDCPLAVSTPENTLAGVMQGSNFMCSNEGWP